MKKNNDVKRLTDLKDDIANAKEEVSKGKGRLEELMKQLKGAFKCKSTEEAEKEISKMEKNIALMKKTFDKGMEELEEAYEF